MMKSRSNNNNSNINHSILVATAAAAAAVTAAVTAYSYHYYCKKQQQQQKGDGCTTNKGTSTTTTTTTAGIGNEDTVQEIVLTTRDENDIETDDAVPLSSIYIVTEPLSREQQQPKRILSHNTITIVHGSMTGTCSKLATRLYQDIKTSISSTTSSPSSLIPPPPHVQMGCIQDFDWWDELINDENDNEPVGTTSTTSSTTVVPATLLILLPTYTNGTYTPNAVPLHDAIQELQHDWRISKSFLTNKLQVAIFGTGSSEYNDTTPTTTSTPITPIVTTTSSNKNTTTSNNMGQPAKMTIRAFHQWGATILTKLLIGDDATSHHIDTTFQLWKSNVLHELQLALPNTNGTTISSSRPSQSKKQQQQPKKFSTLPMTTTATAMTGTAADTVVAADTVAEHTNSRCCGNNNHGSEKKNDNSSNTTCCQNKEVTTTTSNGCCQNNLQREESGPTMDVNDKHFDDNDKVEDDNYEEEDDYFDEEDDDDEDDDDDAAEPDVMDLEDIGDALVQSPVDNSKNNEPREMVTPSQAIALKKEGYKLIGTHSAVKLCRWTKHQLRGRGGCYKHTFYGITSYQCMEATPSLACANKCVFCWRHHKNPVGKEWRWKTDDPYYIVDEAVQTHIHMIKETRGIPGVQLDRWKEAHTVKHCALSLVGEPIMYPRIDELLGELHRRKISTFLVTNGQHPTAIGSIRPITQLYVSVDAPTETSLIAIDRPLFQDAWDRLRLSLSSLKDKGQRTVARLTVVKGWNSDEISGYAELIALGQVSLVEVKGVTFCGKSDASNLNMTNTPWHHEVVELTRTLKDELDKMRTTVDPNIPEYDLACEHKHSCSVLLARVDQFATEGYDTVTGQRKWRTWIDYDTFHKLALQHQADPTKTFSVVDYTAPTPDWAIFGAKEEGFDPTDRRHRKQTKYPKYTQFDSDGVPTHDDNQQELITSERQRLRSMMEAKKRQIGDGSTVTELRGGEKEVLDASLMFRGLVVAK